MDTPRILSRDGLEALLIELRGDGYSLVGPRERDGAITYDEISGIEDLPEGLREVQSAGRYRLESSSEPTWFGFSSTAQSFKRFFYPPQQQLFSLRRGPNGPQLLPAPRPEGRLALIGARGCDLAGLRTLDGVLARGAHPDPDYAERRQGVFVVAVHCTVAGGTCFCSSMGTGPRAERDFDLALTEMSGQFLVHSGSESGRQLLDRLVTRPATEAELEEADRLVEENARAMPQRVETAGLQQLLQAEADSPVWNDMESRCLACGACTMVCPTCFCADTEETNGWDGQVGRSRTWDSCFTSEHSYIHGGPVRPSTKSRYRQWLTHKFSTWFDQFGSSGCVGCGRCVTWCPVGIDITEELAKVRRSAESEGVAK